MFEGHEGDAIVVSLVDMGGRRRRICQDIGEAHVKELAHLTTLAGYIHWLLAGAAVEII